ncbi:MAG: fimbrillin family protein [Rikenellaceae bacterium]
MKSTKYISTLFALATFMGCESGNESFDDLPLSSPRTISVTTMATRASEVFDTNNSFYLYIDQSADDYDYFVKMVNDGGVWVAKSLLDDSTIDMVMVDNAADINISALYCYDRGLSLTDYTSAETAYEDGVDLLYANIDEDSTLSITDEGAITIDFKHVLSSLCVTITTVEDITSQTVTGVMPYFTWAASEGSSAVTASGDSTSKISFTSGEKLYFAPQTISSLTVDVALASGNYADTRSDVQLISTQEFTMEVVAGNQSDQ